MWLPNRTHTQNGMDHRELYVLRHLHSIRVAYRSVLTFLCFIFFLLPFFQSKMLFTTVTLNQASNTY